MKIDKNTKISRILKENPEAIEAIASINKHFRKLRNPVLRKMLASRVNIADAAKIGGSSVNAFFEKLAPFGFEPETQTEEIITNTQNIFEMDKFKKENVVQMDVRPTIKSGNDPFKEIMTAIKTLPENAVLEIINVFEPIPLINNLREKGFVSFTERPNEGEVHTFFKKTGQTEVEDKPKQEHTDLSAFELKVAAFGENIRTIDVRELEMPMPMATILEEIETLPENHGLYVHHKRIPQFLLPELEKRGYSILSNEVDKENLNLLIYK
ncbi:MAG: hypothetical protein DRJ05_19525 [Bacteroidetes bacterium]|nr:MAG: hypothetical protein DRJ05_19525 [Bacteroidota bacterium]